MRVGKSTSVRNKLALHFVGACSLTGSNTTHHFLSIILFYFMLIVAFRAKYIAFTGIQWQDYQKTGNF